MAVLWALVVVLILVVLYCVLQVQQILLVADKALNGSFTLSFNGAVTAPLDAQALLWATVTLTLALNGT